MDFCFLRARGSILSTSILALSLSMGVGTPGAWAQAAGAASGQAGAPAGQAGSAPAGQAGSAPAGQAGSAPAGQAGAAPAQKNYKDRGEYDLYSKVTQTADPKARLQVLQEWQDKYPQTDFIQERSQLFLATLAQLAGSDPSVRQQLIDKASATLKTDPSNFLAGYYISLYGPALGGTSASPDLLSQVDTGAHAVLDNADKMFPPEKKPANMTPDQWAQTKSQALAIGHNSLAWEATQKKDTATAENEYKASLQANPNDSRVAAAYGKLLIDDKKVPQGLYEFARAGVYDGQGSLPQAGRDQALNYFKTQYANYHGSADGSQQILDQAKTTAVAPDGFNIVSANDLAQQGADALNARINSDPAFKIWYAIKQNLVDKGDPFFTSDIKEAEIPGGGENGGPKTFSGTVISLDPADKPTKVVLGVEDPTKPDATLEFSEPLTPDALNTVKTGAKIDFSGVAESYTKDPYMLTFKDPTIPGVKTTTPPRKGRTGRRR